MSIESFGIALSHSLLSVALLLLLPGCQSPPRAHQSPPPLGSVHPPDTRTLGAADARLRGAFALAVIPDCGMRADEALQRINAARAQGRRCGKRSMPPAPALRWDAQLYSAAAGHSSDMARRNYFEHHTPEGRALSDRVSASRYPWRSVGENLAGGTRSIAEAVEAWLDSPAHCSNLMDRRYVDMAVACSAQSGTDWGTYWTLVLGRK